MSLDADLSKLKKLIEKYQNGTFDSDDCENFAQLLKSVQLDTGLIDKGMSRSRSLSQLDSAIKAMTAYAETHPMPQDKYNKQLFRLCVLELDGYRDEICLLSASQWNGRNLEAGVYRWVCPAAYGYQHNDDSLVKLNSENVRQMNLSSVQIERIIAKRKEITEKGSLVPGTQEEMKKAARLVYERRWPGRANDWFGSYSIRVEKPDLFDQLELGKLSEEFNVEVTVDFGSNSFHLFGPEDNVKGLWERLKPFNEDLFLNVASKHGLDVALNYNY